MVPDASPVVAFQREVLETGEVDSLHKNSLMNPALTDLTAIPWMATVAASRMWKDTAVKSVRKDISKLKGTMSLGAPPASATATQISATWLTDMSRVRMSNSWEYFLSSSYSRCDYE